MNKAIFLDRDGVLNQDRVNYAYRLEDFKILPKVPETLQMLKNAGYALIIVTNQSGIAKGIYTKKEVLACYQYLQKQCNNLIDGHYYAPYHPNFTESLTRKPDSLMFEKAIAKWKIDVKTSWMIGDKERDILAGLKAGIEGILITGQSAKEDLDLSQNSKTRAKLIATSLYDATINILNQ